MDAFFDVFWFFGLIGIGVTFLVAFSRIGELEGRIRRLEETAPVAASRPAAPGNLESRLAAELEMFAAEKDAPKIAEPRLTADLAGRYPHARLLGVEADHDNALLARRNLAHLGGRCALEETAVWYRDETLNLNWEPDAWGQIVTGPVPGNRSAATTRHVGAVDAANLLGAFTGPAPVDYLLVNIESAWYEMLRHGRWTANVDCIKVEIQDHYDEAVPLLESLGYQAQLRRLDWGAFAIGIRPR